MVRSILLKLVLPLESTTCGVSDSVWSSSGATAGTASGAASISGAAAESISTGAGAGVAIAARMGNPVVVIVALLMTGSGLLEGLSDGSGIDCRTGITAPTVRGVRSLSAAAGASMSCLGVRVRPAVLLPTDDAPDTARCAHAMTTAAASAIRSVR